jgi:hypothetical protein
MAHAILTYRVYSWRLIHEQFCSCSPRLPHSSWRLILYHDALHVHLVAMVSSSENQARELLGLHLHFVFTDLVHVWTDFANVNVWLACYLVEPMDK